MTTETKRLSIWNWMKNHVLAGVIGSVITTIVLGAWASVNGWWSGIATRTDIVAAKDEISKEMGNIVNDNKRTLCLLCRKMKGVRDDSLCVEKGCNLQASIDIKGKTLTLPVLPASPSEVKVATAENAADGNHAKDSVALVFDTNDAGDSLTKFYVKVKKSQMLSSTRGEKVVSGGYKVDLKYIRHLQSDGSAHFEEFKAAFLDGDIKNIAIELSSGAAAETAP